MIVRAKSAFEARVLAAAEFEKQADSKDTLFDPWMQETDTNVEQCEDARYSAVGKPEVLYPKRDSVLA